MKKLYTVQFILTITAILLTSLGLNAQEPVATTADGKVVFLESDVKKFPAERQEAIRKLPRFIIIESRSELENIEAEHGLKDRNDSGPSSSDRPNPASNSSEDLKENLNRMHRAGEISEQEYSKAMEDVNKHAATTPGEQSPQTTEKENTTLNADGDVPGSKTAQAPTPEKSGEPMQQDDEANEDEIVSPAERALQEADSYEDLKRGKKEIREQIDNGELDIYEGRMLIHQYNQAMKELSAGDGEGKSSDTQPEYSDDQERDRKETEKDLPPGITLDEYQKQKENENLRDSEKERLQKEGYSDEEIQDVLDEKYPTR